MTRSLTVDVAMTHKPERYTFLGLLNDGVAIDTPVTTLAYLVGLVDTHENKIADLEIAKFVLRSLFEIEEQVTTANELMELQKRRFPKGYSPQTPVMLTERWSPVGELLRLGWEPMVLKREDRGMNCASGIWQFGSIRQATPHAQCATPEELFWYVLSAVRKKGVEAGMLLSLVAMPGWSYHAEQAKLDNLTASEAEKAGRVIWQRKPNAVTGS